jgi:hypothetical protein
VRLLRVRRRRAVGWAIVVFTLGLFVFGIAWAAFYYGVIQPLQTQMTTSYPQAYDSVSLAFVDTLIAWWPFIVLAFDLLWLWQKSNKQGLTY